MTAKQQSESVWGSAILGIAVALAGGWACWVMLSPNFKLDSQDVEPLTTALESTYAVLDARLARANVRLVAAQGNNLEIYMTTAALESVPYPDQSEFVDRIADAWCNRVDGTFLPSVKVRDIKTGEELASRNCLFHSQSSATYTQTSPAQTPATVEESPALREKVTHDVDEDACVYRLRQGGIKSVEGKSVEEACKENPNRNP